MVKKSREPLAEARKKGLNYLLLGLSFELWKTYFTYKYILVW